MDRAALEIAGERRRSPLAPAEVLMGATRALFWVESATDAKLIAVNLVSALGGSVVSSSRMDGDALPVDLSFGQGEPVVPCAPTNSAARMLLERCMPSFIVDAHRALELRTRMDRLVEAASVDTLTGLPNRRAMGRALGRLKADDVVIMLDLDHFKRVNDTLGHAGGDQVLSGLGRALQATVRGTDLAGRFGGEEFLIVLSGTSDPDAFLRRLRVIWSAVRPSPITFSAGIALAGEKVNQAVGAADQAMYRAKESGRDQWAWALPDEYSSQGPILRPSSVAPEQDGAFVAFSQIHVPEGGAGQVETAFRERLGAVEKWPGFRSLEVWSDGADPTGYAMVSWWDSAADFSSYMRSDDHRRSHQRIPTGDLRPRAREFRRYRVVAR